MLFIIQAVRTKLMVNGESTLLGQNYDIVNIKVLLSLKEPTFVWDLILCSTSPWLPGSICDSKVVSMEVLGDTGEEIDGLET